jgi:hypothetical protein
VALVCSLAVSAAGQRPSLWRDPGAVERLDLHGGPGGQAGAPRPPFTFVDEDTSGSTPKVTVRDPSGRRWTVKWGEEAKPEVFASRIVWAAGYHVEPTYFVPSGTIRSVRKLDRAGKHVDENGKFRNARFELRSGSEKYLHDVDWTWEKNPFVNTRELNGLKVLVMLLSNWDNKDGRDTSSNTAILQRGSGRSREWTYLVTDWGGSMGKWGNVFTRSKWNCDGYASQSRDFIKEVSNGGVRFGFSGQHDNAFKEDIKLRDVRWLMRFLGRLTDAQILSALRAAGASAHEQSCFSAALRSRIRQLQQAVASGERARLE